MTSRPSSIETSQQEIIMPAKVVERIKSEEDGYVYEQLVLAEVSSRILIAIFDSPPLVSDSFDGKLCGFRLLAFLPKLKRLDKPKYGIVSWDKRMKPQIHNPAFRGRVSGVVGDDLILDTGLGAVLVDCRTQDSVDVGTFIEISDFRLDRIGEPVILNDSKAKSST